MILPHIIYISIIPVVALYNGALYQYSEWKVRRMQAIPLYATQQPTSSSSCDSMPPMTVKNLRNTVSWGSGIVENLNSRRAWNSWLISPPPNQLSKTIDPKNSFHPGHYCFKYRSYSNFEEAGAIRKKWGHIKEWIGFTAVRPGILTLFPDGKIITLEEDVRFRIFTPVKIRWTGKLCEEGFKKKRHWIEWTDTEMTIGKTYIKSPEAAEKMRKIDWEITKVEDDMLAIKRGDLGMLAYGREQ